MIFWFIWLFRNDAANNGVRFSAFAIIKRIYRAIFTIGAVADASFWRGFLHLAPIFGVTIRPEASTKPMIVQWTPPVDGWVKLNVDGAFQESSAGGGGVVRNHLGEVLLVFQAHFQASNALHAEAQALKSGIHVLSNNFQHFSWCIELDAQAIIQALDNFPSGGWEIQGDLLTVRQLCEGRQVHFQHVFREANSAADHMAGRGATEKVSAVLKPPHIPRDVLKICRLEQIGVPYFRKKPG